MSGATHNKETGEIPIEDAQGGSEQDDAVKALLEEWDLHELLGRMAELVSGRARYLKSKVHDPMDGRWEDAAYLEQIAQGLDELADKAQGAGL